MDPAKTELDKPNHNGSKSKTAVAPSSAISAAGGKEASTLGGSQKPKEQPGPGAMVKTQQTTTEPTQKPAAKQDLFTLVKQAKLAKAAGERQHDQLTKKEKVKGTIEKLKGNVDLEEETSTWAIVYKKLGIHHWGLLLIVVIYAFIGAAIFEAIEGPAEAEKKLTDAASAHRDAQNLTQSIVSLLDCTKAKTTLVHDVERLIKRYQDANEIGPSTRTNWDLWGSMFYAGTLFTTIGYGHYSPATTGGRVATMIYALFGIPILLATLNDLGILLTRAIKHPWNYVRGAIHRHWHHFLRRRRRQAAAREGTPSKTPLNEADKNQAVADDDGDLDDDFKSESTDQLEEFNFPVPMALFLFFLWIVVCAPIFCIWEDWSYFTSFYFFFVSLTTIGLGDVVPDHPAYMIMMFPLVLMGLSLISMCVNLVQQRLAELKEDAFDFFEDQLGWDTESSDEGSEDEFGNVRLKPDKGGGHSRQGSVSRKPSASVLGILGGAGKISPSPKQSTAGKSAALKFASKWKGKALDEATPEEPKTTPAQQAQATTAGDESQSHAKPVHRKRRGVQTDESYIRTLKRELRRKYPGIAMTEIPMEWMLHSRDDVSSLVDETDVTVVLKKA